MSGEVKAWFEKSVRQLGFAGGCDESVRIDANGNISLPGFESPTVRSKWTLDGKQIEISRSDAFGFVYDGVYDIEFSGKWLILKSENTTIYCHLPESISIQRIIKQ